jgi:hypothetical protein
VFRFDTRTWDEINKAGGFDSWGIDMNLLEHAKGNSTFDRTSGYVSTTFSLKAAKNFS